MAVHTKYVGRVICLAGDSDTDYGPSHNFYGENGHNSMLMLTAEEQVSLRDILLARHPIEQEGPKEWTPLT